MRRELGNLGFIISIIMMLTNGCTLKTYSVVFKVEGTAQKVDIMYVENGKTQEVQQLEGISIPWEHSFTGHYLQGFSILAQNVSETGYITLSVYIDGELYKKGTNDDEYGWIYIDGVLGN